MNKGHCTSSPLQHVSVTLTKLSGMCYLCHESKQQIFWFSSALMFESWHILFFLWRKLPFFSFLNNFIVIPKARAATFDFPFILPILSLKAPWFGILLLNDPNH